MLPTSPGRQVLNTTVRAAPWGGRRPIFVPQSQLTMSFIRYGDTFSALGIRVLDERLMSGEHMDYLFIS